MATMARPTLFFCADFFLVDCRGKKRNLMVKKSSKSIKQFKSYDFAVYTIELGQILLIDYSQTSFSSKKFYLIVSDFV